MEQEGNRRKEMKQNHRRRSTGPQVGRTRKEGNKENRKTSQQLRPNNFRGVEWKTESKNWQNRQANVGKRHAVSAGRSITRLSLRTESEETEKEDREGKCTVLLSFRFYLLFSCAPLYVFCSSGFVLLCPLFLSLYSQLAQQKGKEWRKRRTCLLMMNIVCVPSRLMLCPPHRPCPPSLSGPCVSRNIYHIHTSLSRICSPTLLDQSQLISSAGHQHGCNRKWSIWGTAGEWVEANDTRLRNWRSWDRKDFESELNKSSNLMSALM